MALEVDGIPIMRLGDFTTLVNGLTDDAKPLGTLAAWRNWEEVNPEDLYQQLDVTCRAHLRNDEAGDQARDVIDAALEQLKTVPGVLAA